MNKDDVCGDDLDDHDMLHTTIGTFRNFNRVDCFGNHFRHDFFEPHQNEDIFPKTTEQHEKLQNEPKED